MYFISNLKKIIYLFLTSTFNTAKVTILRCTDEWYQVMVETLAIQQAMNVSTKKPQKWSLSLNGRAVFLGGRGGPSVGVCGSSPGYLFPLRFRFRLFGW